MKGLRKRYGAGSKQVWRKSKLIDDSKTIEQEPIKMDRGYNQSAVKGTRKVKD